MKTRNCQKRGLRKGNTPTQRERDDVLARLCATVDPNVLAVAKAFANATGFRNSFSAYLNDVLDRDNKQRGAILSNARA